jgi:hypothetical protein
MMITLALVLIGIGLGAVAARWWFSRPPAPVVPIAHHDDSAQLLLCSKQVVEHEIAWHGSHVPGHYSYAGKRYVRHAQRKDGTWEFRR